MNPLLYSPPGPTVVMAVNIPALVILLVLVFAAGALAGAFVARYRKAAHR